MSQASLPDRIFFEHLRNGSSKELAVSDPASFSWESPENEDSCIERINIIGRAGSIDLVSELLGATGLKIELFDTDGSVLFDYGDGGTFKTIHDLSLLAGTDSGNNVTQGQGDDAWSLRWTLARAGRAPRLSAGQGFRIVVQDDLSGFTTLQAMLQGYK